MVKQQALNNLSEEVKKGMAQKRAAGGWCHRAPFGYSNIKKDGRTTVIPNEDAFLVKQIFQLALNNYSITKIYEEIKKHKKIARSQIHTIVSNPFYIGYMKTKEGLLKGNYETIIDSMPFKTVQGKLKQNNNKITAVDRSFRFSGLLACECGSKMYGELKKGKYVTYGCGARIIKKKCSSVTKYLSETKVFDQLE